MALTPFTSRIIADTGISMGDEGKGRLVYELITELKASTQKASPVGMVLKVNGGANSGHTAAGIKLNLLPAGVVEPSVTYLAIGMGVVADPRKFLWEALPLEAQGFHILRRLVIDEKTMVSDFTHRLLDLSWEDYRIEKLKENPRGSTGRGITPAFSDEVNHWQIYYGDFLGSKDVFVQKMTLKIGRALKTIEHVCELSPDTWFSLFERLSDAETKANKAAIDQGLFSKEDFDFRLFASDIPFCLNKELLIDTYWKAGQKLLTSIADVREKTLEVLGQNQYIIGEFGQSYWLDKRHGFTPNVTASHTYTPEFFQSAGIPVQPIHTVGCSKAYDTKVGTHLFLTQMPKEHPLAQKLSLMEFGTSTGRQRMVGWFDAVEKGEALRHGGFEDLAINKLDALSYEGAWMGGELLICTHYRTPEGKAINYLPRNEGQRAALKPCYEQLPGWEEDLSQIRFFEDLPKNAKRYIAHCYKAVIDVATRNNHPISLPNLRYIGVGPDPDQIIKDVPTPEGLLELAEALRS